MIGSITFWDRKRGFGFITKDDGSEVFVHSKQIARSRLTAPSVGDRFRFALMIAGNNQIQACDLQRISDRDLDAAAGG
jgi:cold shock CspA family protein